MPDSLCHHCARRDRDCPIDPDGPITYCVEARPRDASAARSMQWIVAGSEPPSRRALIWANLLEPDPCS
jgi:hypothetical protein